MADHLTLEEARLIAIVRNAGPIDLHAAANALYQGGVRAIEITLDTPGAVDAVSSLKSSGLPALLGIGTILQPSDARTAIEAGADFIVTPTMQPKTIALAVEARVPIAVGCLTPTEALTAHEHGAHYIKLFPADTLGPNFVKSLLAPLPFLKVIPTGGVSIDNMRRYLDAGSCAVGIGGCLVSSDIVKSCDWLRLAELARDYVAAVN